MTAREIDGPFPEGDDVALCCSHGEQLGGASGVAADTNAEPASVSECMVAAALAREQGVYLKARPSSRCAPGCASAAAEEKREKAAMAAASEGDACERSEEEGGGKYCESFGRA